MNVTTRPWLVCLLLLWVLPTWAKDTLTLGVFAYRPKAVVQAQYQPLADYLNSQLRDTEVRLEVLEQWEIEDKLARSQLDFVLTNPSHYLVLRSKYTLTGALATLVRRENGQATPYLGGTIIALAEQTAINGLPDLKDRRIAVPGFQFLGGYQAQAYELLQAGVRLPSGADIAVVSTHDKVVEAVLSGHAEAGFIRTGVLESMVREGKVDPSRLKVLNPKTYAGFPFQASTHLYPEWAFIALPHVNARSVRHVVSALLALEHDSTAARAAEIDGFTPPADYLPVEHLAQALRMPPFDSTPAFTWSDLWDMYAAWIVALSLSLLLLAGAMVVLVVGNRRLNQNKAWLQSLIDNLPDLVWLKDGDGVYRFCNHRFEQVYGAPSAEIVGKTDYDFVDKAMADTFRAHDRAAVTKGAPYFYENTFVFASDGHQEQLEVTKTPIFATNGHLIGVLSVGHDITQRTAAEQALAESEARFRNLFEHNSSVMLLIDPASGEIVSANLAAARYYGYEHGRLVGMNISRINTMSPEKVALARRQAQEGQTNTFNFTHRLSSGETRDVEVHSTPVRVGGKSLLFSIIHDVTERLRADERLRLAASVFTQAREGIMITDANGRIVEVNDAFSRITGFGRQDVLGANPRILKSGRQSPEFYVEMWNALTEKGHWSGELWNRRKDGQVYAEMTTISAVRDATGATRNFVALFTDITPLKEHQKQLEHIAHFDALTHLPNRVLLADRLRQAMAQSARRNEQLAVVYLDLDGFKTVNDSHGHDAGDDLLIAISQRMKHALRDGDTLARIGGDEFVAVLVGLERPEDCEQVLSRLLLAASDPVLIAGIPLSVTASIGVTIFPQDTGDAEQLMRHADQAMYVAKQGGKNRYHLFDVDQDAAVKTLRETVEHIRLALAAHQFVLHYQPKVNMKSGDVVGAEALVRWQHPQRGLLAPAEFLPFIEGHPVSVDLGNWVIATALAQLDQWLGQDLRLPVSVNIDGHHLLQEDFAARLKQHLAAFPQVPTHFLELEVLETSALEDMPRLTEIMRDCLKLGVKFALDDFGTGYSSLTYLKRLPADLLKIDQSFVRAMLDNPEDLAIVNGVMGLASAFRRDIIAEGVETEAHGELLMLIGCELGQGYGIAKPMPAEALPSWAAQWRPYPTWSAWQDHDFHRDDLPLLFADVELRGWIRTATHCLEEDTTLSPFLSEHQCQLGRWYHNQGRVRYGQEAAFHAIDPLHRRIHGLADEIHALLAQGSKEEALARLEELRSSRDELMRQLKALPLGEAQAVV